MTVAPTFYWYDYETFGLKPGRDRPAQFAGVRSTMDFEPLGEADVLYDRPAQDVLPSVESCLITGITPQECEEKGMVEADFARMIFERLNTPNTVSVGYNTIGFDDNVNRFLFWRNFLPPYDHVWRNGCSRWDIYPLVVALWVLRGDNGSLTWTYVEDARSGKVRPVFKLEVLTKTNGIGHQKAHDASSDAYATMALAKHIATTEPRLWQWAFNRRDKKSVMAELDKGPALWISPKLGIANHYHGIVGVIGAGATPNEVLLWNLKEDPSQLLTLSHEEIRQRLRSRSECEAAGVTRLPITKIKLNEAPFICGTLGVLSAERAVAMGTNLDVAREHYQRLLDVRDRVADVIREEWEANNAFAPAESAEEALYDAFLSNEDAKLAAWVANQDAERLFEAVRAGKVNFDDERLTAMLPRYLARNWPEHLSDEERAQWMQYCRDTLIESGRLNRFNEEIDVAQEKLFEMGDDDGKDELIGSLYEWGERLSNQIDFA